MTALFPQLFSLDRAHLEVLPRWNTLSIESLRCILNSAYEEQVLKEFWPEVRKEERKEDKEGREKGRRKKKTVYKQKITIEYTFCNVV